MKTVTGLLHIHTTYSYDGRITLDDISSIARSKGHGFLLLTEHSDDFSPRKMEALREHSQRLSDKDFVIIPGLEVNCDLGRHLLAVGVTRYISEEKPDDVVREIADSGGLAILPHPSLYQFRSFLSSGAYLNGVEVWNSRYDTRCVPNLKSFELLNRLRKENASVFAYGGLDLHEKKNADRLFLKLQPKELSADTILAELRDGNFQVVGKTAAFSGRGNLSSVRRLYFDVFGALAILYRSVMRRDKL